MHMANQRRIERKDEGGLETSPPRSRRSSTR